MVTPRFVDKPHRSDCTAGQMDREAGWWTTSGNIGLPPHYQGSLEWVDNNNKRGREREGEREGEGEREKEREKGGRGRYREKEGEWGERFINCMIQCVQ